MIAGTIPGHEIEHPMALVILGGLVTSTLVNLFIVPSLYLRFGRPRRPAGGELRAGAALLGQDLPGQRRRDLLQALADGGVPAGARHDLLDRVPDLVVGQAEAPGGIEARTQRGR